MYTRDGVYMIVNYQPVIALATGRVAKVEVLTRSGSPGQSVSEMVRNAEASGSIKRMNERVMDIAFAEWRKHGRSDIGISINLSLRNLDERDLAKRVEKALKKHRVDARSLWFEVDDSAQQLTNGAWIDRMRELTSLGVRFSVDGFGSGEISQATIPDLGRMPIAELKIDGRIVADADSNIRHRNGITSTIQVARQLNLATSAKGIERVEIATLIAKMGCTYAQGYFYARPLPIATLGSAIDSYHDPATVAGARG